MARTVPPHLNPYNRAYDPSARATTAAAKDVQQESGKDRDPPRRRVIIAEGLPSNRASSSQNTATAACAADTDPTDPETAEKSATEEEKTDEEEEDLDETETRLPSLGLDRAAGKATKKRQTPRMTDFGVDDLRPDIILLDSQGRGKKQSYVLALQGSDRCDTCRQLDRDCMLPVSIGSVKSAKRGCQTCRIKCSLAQSETLRAVTRLDSVVAKMKVLLAKMDQALQLIGGVHVDAESRQRDSQTLSASDPSDDPNILALSNQRQEIAHELEAYVDLLAKLRAEEDEIGVERADVEDA